MRIENEKLRIENGRKRSTSPRPSPFMGREFGSPPLGEDLGGVLGVWGESWEVFKDIIAKLQDCKIRRMDSSLALRMTLH